MFSNYDQNSIQQEIDKYKIKISECSILFPNDFIKIGHYFSELVSSLSLSLFAYTSHIKTEIVSIFFFVYRFS